MGASLSRRGASPDEGAPEAPEAPKRPRAASKEEVQFTKVLEDGHNVSAILAFAGYRNVLTLEALCPRARRLIRGARVELDVSNETNLVVAVKAAARAELFEARRTGASGAKTHYKFVFDDCRRRASDVVYRDDRALLLSPRARAPALVEGFRGADVDAARSACAVAAKDRRRAALLAIGYFEVELGSRDVAGIAARQNLVHHLSKRKETESEAAAPEDAARLIEAMGGAVVTPRRLQLAAGRRRVSRQEQIYGTPAHLRRAMRQAARASALLTEASMERLVVFFWKSASRRGWSLLNEEVFLDEVCGAAAIGTAEAHAVWQEALSGVLLPLAGVFVDGSGVQRDEGDVRAGDVAHVTCFPFLWPAVSAFAIVSLAREPAVCFSPSHHLAGLTFEQLVIRKEFKCSNDTFSLALAVLDELGAQRDGEVSSEAGKQRVSEAVQSLLSEERVHALAAGDEVEVAEGGDPDPPRLSPIEWIRGTIVSFKETKKAVVRVGEEEKEVFLASVRLIEDWPCAAVVLLSRALADRRNDIALQILQSPLMKAPLSYVVGEPGKGAISLRTDARCTVLDHAMDSKNVVGIGLLWKAAAFAPAQSLRVGDESAWNAVRGSSHCLAGLKAQADTGSPSERADLFCAMREGPGVMKSRFNVWQFFEVWAPEELNFIEANWATVAAMNGDIDGIRKALGEFSAGSLRARLVARPWQVLSSLWGQPAPDPVLYDRTREFLLNFACKMGGDDVIPEVLNHSATVVDILPPLTVALAEGYQRCVERLLACTGPTLEHFVSASAPDATLSRNTQMHRMVCQAIDVGNAAAIDLLRSVGVKLHSEVWNYRVLEVACRAGQDGCVRALLRDQAIFESVRERHSDAVHVAARHGRASALAVLLESFDLSHTNQNAFSDGVLVCAVTSDDSATVQLVLQQPGANIDFAPPGRQTAIMVAARALNYDVAAMLVARGANLGEPRSEVGESFDTLDYALKYSFDDETCEFVEKKLDAAKLILRLCLQTRPDFASNFLVYFKSHYLHEDLIKIFIEFGANVCTKDAIGITALHVCTYNAAVMSQFYTRQHRLLQAAETLIIHGADVTAKTTAAATNSSFPMFDEDPLDAGMTPLDVARHCGHPLRREAVTKALQAAIRKRDAAAGRTPRVETGS